jgi:hypothetical protein
VHEEVLPEAGVACDEFLVLFFSLSPLSLEGIQTIRKNKAIAVEVVAIRGRVFHDVFPQRNADGRHAHGRSIRAS